MIYICVKVGKKKIDMNLLLSVKVFFIFVRKLINILFCIKKIDLRYCMHLYDKYKDLFYL